MVGSVGYVATRTIHQLIDRNINAVGPGLGTTTANLPLAKAYGRTIATNMWDGIGVSNYHSLQTSLNKSFSKGLMAKVNYTFGKSLSMADEDGWVGLAALQLGADDLQATTVPPAMTAHTCSPPAGTTNCRSARGKKLEITNKFADALIGGWKMSGIFVAYSGTPFTVTGSGSSLQATGNSQTADQIGPVTKIGNKGPGQFYYAPLSFIDPQITFNQTGVYRFGTMGRNSLRGPGYAQLSPGIYKNFKVKERVNAELRAEATNISNTPIWGNPGAGAASLRRNPDGSLNTGVADPYQNFMSITGATAGRQFRFGLRVAF